MFTSNEPGFYKTGEYGIRIENLVIAHHTQKNDFGQFMNFETVTLFPIDRRLVEKSWLTEGELSWLNAYHARVFASVSPLLNDEEKMWLAAQCAEI
jgi:Xaa-Pro aminopeptidase